MVSKSGKLQHSMLGLAMCVLLYSGCSSQPIKPSADSVELTRSEPSKDCRPIGRVEGTVSTHRGTIEEAIEDMKLDAARRGANFVKMEATSAIGTAVSGMAFHCP